MPRVAFCRALHPSARALLDARPEFELELLSTEFRGKPIPDKLAAALPHCDGVMIGLEKIGADMLALAPDLKVVSRFGVGYDNFDVPACTRQGVTIAVTNGANDLSVAEHTMMLMLAVARRTTDYDASVRAGTWMIQTGRRMHELAGRKVLIIGYGRIGTRVARLCQAFGMTTMVADPAFPVPRLAADGHIPVTDLAAALPQADIVSLHCWLDATTRKMVNADFLKRMKPTAWLINTARGGLVDEPALAAALTSGTLEAAGLEVMIGEPPPANHPFFSLPNLVLSPHNATAAMECFEKMSIRAIRNLIEFFDSTLDPGYTVNPETLRA